MACGGRAVEVATGRLKSMGEVVGLGAVVLGLVFVGLELRSNTEAVRASTFQNLTDISNDYIMEIAADPDLSRILHAARAGGLGALDPADSVRFWSLERAFWVRMQNVYSQYERGTLTEDDFVLYRSVICDAPEAGRALWPEHRSILTPSFIRFIQACWGTGGESG